LYSELQDSSVSALGCLISTVIVGWLNETTNTMAAGQIYLAAHLMVGAVTVAIGAHDRKQVVGRSTRQAARQP
jgi:hypothetical protein